MDIKGPMDMMSIGKHLYFLISVDDYSALTVAYPIQKKSDALKFYRGFAEQAWNQTGKRISYQRCDNAKEFLSSAFNEYPSTQGTVLQEMSNHYTSMMMMDEKKDAQAPIEDVKERTSEKPAFKIAKQRQPVLRRSLRLKAKEDAKKEKRKRNVPKKMI
jgi:hypothetical protein